LSNQAHQLRNAIGVNLVSLEKTKDTGKRIQGTLLVHELELRGVPDDVSIPATTLVLGEHVDLRDRLARIFGHFLHHEQRAVLIEHGGWIEERDTSQFSHDLGLLYAAPS